MMDADLKYGFRPIVRVNPSRLNAGIAAQQPRHKAADTHARRFVGDVNLVMKLCMIKPVVLCLEQV
jgi:hypothetical protein